MMELEEAKVFCAQFSVRPLEFSCKANEMKHIVRELALYDALTTAEQERKLYEKSIDGWKFRAEHAEARVKELEAAVLALKLAGLNLHDRFNPITILRWNQACEQADKAVGL